MAGGGSRTLTTAPTTAKGDAIGVGVGVLPPPANPIAVATDPVTGAPIIRQTEAPREVAAGASGTNVIPPDKAGNAQDLPPLRGPKGPPLSGAKLVAAVGPVKAAAIEASRSGAVASVASVASPPAPPPSPVQKPPVTAVGALAATAQALGLRTPRKRPVPSVETAKVETASPPVEQPPAEPEAHGPADVVLAEHLDTEDVPLAPIQPHQKAASNTDSPSRGIPQTILDPGKKITGGFGELTDGQYHPLNGSELKQLVEALLDDVHARIQDDLRFSMALTYPRVRAKVMIVVEGIAQTDGFAIEKVVLADGKSGKPGSTPIELARSLGDEIVFVVTALRQEFDAEGKSISPPNQIREDLGIEVPRKQRLMTPTGYTIADRKNA